MQNFDLTGDLLLRVIIYHKFWKLIGRSDQDRPAIPHHPATLLVDKVSALSLEIDATPCKRIRQAGIHILDDRADPVRRQRVAGFDRRFLLTK